MPTADTLSHCPYCGADVAGGLGATPLSDHLLGAHREDAEGEYRCPAVVEQRKALGLPPEGHDAPYYQLTDGGQKR